MIEVRAKDGKHQVVFAADGKVLFESADRTAALARASILSEIADRRGARATSDELQVLFPATAPAPLILGALSATAASLARTDDLDAASGTWTMRNVELFRTGVAYLGAKKQRTFTTDDVLDFIEAFVVLGWQPPLKIGHNGEQPLLDGLPAIGRVVALRAADVVDQQGQKHLGLFSDWEKVPEVLHAAIKDGALYQRSIEFWEGLTAPDGKTRLPMVLKAVSLLGADLPAVRGMPPIDVAPPRVAASVDSESVTTPLESKSPMTTPPNPGAGTQVTLSAQEYEALKTSQAEAASLKAEQKALKDRLNRVEIDRRVEGATNVAARLRTEGKISPAQEALAIELLKSLDDEKADAITLSTVDENKKPREEKLSARQAFVRFVESMPKQAGAPGAPGTSGTRDTGTAGGSFQALSAEERSQKVAALGKKYKGDSAKGFKTDLAAYAAARKDLESGAVKAEEV